MNVCAVPDSHEVRRKWRISDGKLWIVCGNVPVRSTCQDRGTGITVVVFAKTMDTAKSPTCLAYDTSVLGTLAIAVILASR